MIIVAPIMVLFRLNNKDDFYESLVLNYLVFLKHKILTIENTQA